MIVKILQVNKMKNFNINDYLYNYDEKKLMGALFFEVSDVTIYIEDTASGMRNFYKKLLERKFPTINIDNIVPLGKKTEVIKACQEKKFKKSKEIYIIDGDLDIVLCQKVKFKSLFQHNVYCIENYLFDEDAVSHFISNESGKIDDIELIKKTLELDLFLNTNSLHFIEIYKLFAIIYKHQLNITTITRFDNSIYTFKKNYYTTINSDTISKNFTEIKNLIISQIGDQQFYSDFNKVNHYINTLNIKDYKKIISGKNELLILLKGYAQYIAKILDKECTHIMQINSSSLKVKLASYTKHPNLNELYHAIEEKINNGYYEDVS